MIEAEVDAEVDLCVVCCSKVQTDNNNSQLLSGNLNAFYLLRKVLQVPGIQLKISLINCGSPAEWIKLCDKCTELTQQAEELYRNLRRIERELNCVHQLIRDKARSSIKSERDRKLGAGEETIDLTGKSRRQVWRRIRNHVANKCDWIQGSTGEETLNRNPFSEGDKLANYLISQRASTAILPNVHSEKNPEEDGGGGHVNILEEINAKVTSSLASVEIKVEVTPELDLEVPQQFVEEEDDHRNDKLVDRLLEEMEEEVDVKQEEDEEMMEVDEQDKRVDKEKQVEREEEDSDWNWEPDDEDDGDEVDEEENGSSEVDEVDLEEEEKEEGNDTLNSPAKEDKEDLKGTPSTHLGVAKVKNVNKVPKVPKKAGKKRGNYFDFGRPIRTEDGKFKCRHCDLTFTSPSGLNGHEREKHSKTPGAFPCDICGRAFNSAAYLQKHRKSLHKLRADGTPIPPKKVPISLARDHICDQCGKGFKTAIQLTSHVRYVHEKRFSSECPTCQMGFSSSLALRKHQLAKHPEDPSTKKLIEEQGLNLWRCPVIGCTTTFLKESNLKAHLKNIHGKDGEQVDGLQLGAWADAGVVDPEMRSTCEICGKIFESRNSFVLHLKLHENEAKGIKFTCESCGKIFYSERLLRHHVKHIHLEKMRGREPKLDKNLKCEFCGKGFAYRSRLRKHFDKKEEGGGGRGCGGGRDFGCEKCGRKFTTEGSLKGHKTRTGCGGEK